MVTRLDGAGEKLFRAVNAACKRADFELLREKLPDLRLEILEDRALLALQGPRAESVLERHLPGVAHMAFMSLQEFVWRGAALLVTRSGYTGEDGFEIWVPVSLADDLAATLLAEEEVRAIGLGARDSPRLEAGLCLYGHELDETTSPIEAALNWSISETPSRSRRLSGRGAGSARIGAGHFPRASWTGARRQGAGARRCGNRQRCAPVFSSGE